MSTLGRYGRFGNQIIQYAFIQIYAKRFGLNVQTSSWIGRDLFGHRDELVYRKYPRIHETQIKNKQKLLTDPHPRLINVDIQGYFQFHTRFYAPYRVDFHSLFEPVPDVAVLMEKGLRRLRAAGKTVIGLHLRRGDFRTRQVDVADKKIYFIPPNEWYIQWLKSIWPYSVKPVLYIASDELESVLPEFSEFSPITYRDLFDPYPMADYYPDHYVLSRCDMLGICSSTFSYTASMLNKRASLFLRPDQELGKLVPYDPWNSPINPWLHLMGL